LTTPSRDELSRTLRDLRTASGLTIREVATKIGVASSTVSRLENGRYVPTPEQVEQLAQAVGARGAVRRHLVSLARDLRERTAPRQVLLRAGAATAQREFGRIEAAAGHVQSFSPVMVLGLLQTADYAREVFASVAPADQVNDAVRARMERQRLLEGEGPPVFTQVMAEGALRWHVGSPELMAQQCEHIAAAAARGGRMKVGIIPWTQPIDVFPMTGFDLYDARAVIVGTITGTAFLKSEGDVADYGALFQRLVGLAVFGEEAQAIAAGIAAQYRSEV
jgi:transcriptional regulator with XRE-family HTH domain